MSDTRDMSEETPVCWAMLTYVNTDKPGKVISFSDNTELVNETLREVDNLKSGEVLELRVDGSTLNDFLYSCGPDERPGPMGYPMLYKGPRVEPTVYPEDLFEEENGVNLDSDIIADHRVSTSIYRESAEFTYVYKFRRAGSGVKGAARFTPVGPEPTSAWLLKGDVSLWDTRKIKKALDSLEYGYSDVDLYLLFDTMGFNEAEAEHWLTQLIPARFPGCRIQFTHNPAMDQVEVHVIRRRA